MVIIAGDQDRVVNIEEQSARLPPAIWNKVRCGASQAPATLLDEALTQSAERETEGGPGPVHGRVQEK